MPRTDSKERFSGRVADYIRYRPSYPPEVLDVLRREANLSERSIVADLGAGTGISTKLLLRSGAIAIAVEPNDAMRAAAEEQLQAEPNFRSVRGSAEATTLADASVDLVFAAQAFHWFDREACRREFRRILRPGGYVAIVWNTRQVDTSAFLRGYEALSQRYATDYAQVDHRNVDEATVRRFYAPGVCKLTTIPNAQTFDFAGLRGRLLSSSYAPPEGDPRYEPMLQALRELFDAENDNGTVRFEYHTEIYVGRLE